MCVVRLGGVGDNIMASSVLPLLAERYNVEFIAQDPYHVVLENNPYIAKLTVKKSGDIPGNGGKEWYDWFSARAKEYEGGLFNLSHTCETRLAVVVAQTEFYRPPAWRRKYCGLNYLEYVHDACCLPHTFAPKFYPTTKELDKAWETKKKIGPKVIGWCIAGSRIDKTYPYSPGAIARLIRELGVHVVLFGAGQHVGMAQTIRDHVERQNGTDKGLHSAIAADYAISTPEQREELGLKPGVINWPLRRGLTQALTCDLMIGPDTGPMWAVSMEDLPKIVLLSHASAENITKHWKNTTTLHANQGRVPCWPCHQLHDTQDTCTPNKEKNGAACISDITVESILKTAGGYLNKGVA